MAIVERKEPTSRSGGLTVDDLLSVAMAQGGAVAEVAQELTHPKTSILSTVGNGFKNAFTGFLDVISMPGQVVAGAVSQEITIGEAVKENISVSDVVFGDDKERELSGLAKVGSFTARLAVDVLTDPLTYVGFGTVQGVFGLSQSSKFFLSKAGKIDENAIRSSMKAANKDVTENEIARVIAKEKSSVINEDTMRSTLVKENDKLAKAGKPIRTAAQIESLVQKGMALGVGKTEMTGKAIALSEQGTEAAADYLKMQRIGHRKMFDSKYRAAAIAQINKAGGIVDEVSIKDTLDTFARTMDDDLVSQTLNKRLTMAFAVDTVGRMIQKNPALIETLVDKGGVKFFGKSILSGERIKSTLPYIPGLTALDHVSQPLRNGVMSLFSQYHTLDGKYQDELIQITQTHKNMGEGMVADFKSKTSKIYQSLNITENEARFISASIDAGISPSDKRAEAVWDVVNGLEPNPGVIRPEVWKAAGYTKDQLKYNRRMLIASGVRVSDHANYFPHMLVMQEVKNMNFRLPPSQQTVRSSFSKNSVLVDDQGKRIATQFDTAPDRSGMVNARVLNDEGELVQKKFRVANTEKEIKKINEAADVAKKEFDKTYKELNDEVKKLGADVKGTFVEKMISVLDDRLGKVNISASERKDLTKAFTKFIDNKSVVTSMSARLAARYKNGVKIKNVGSVAGPDLEKLAAKLDAKNMSLENLIGEINKVIKSDTQIAGRSPAVIKRGKGGAGGKADPEILKLAKEMKETAEKGRINAISSEIDTKDINNLFKDVFDTYMENPKGIRAALDKIIGNAQVVREMSDQFDDVIRSVDIDKQLAIAEGGKYIDEAGKAFTRARIEMSEAKALGVDFEDNALAVMLVSSMDAIKVAVSRDFVREVGQKFGTNKSTAPSFYRAVNVTGLKVDGADISTHFVGNTGEELAFHPKVAKFIEDFTGSTAADAATTDLMRNYDKLQNVFKASVTAVFPAFHGRNAISNVMLSFLDIGYHALNPSKHIAAGSMIMDEAKLGKLHTQMNAVDNPASKKARLEYNQLMNKKVFKDKTGYEWSFAELRGVIKNNVVAFNPRNLGQIDQVSTSARNVAETAEELYPRTKIAKAKKKIQKVNPLSTENIAVQTGLKVGSLVEDQARLVNFLANLEKTGDPLLAAERTKMFLFDYNNLSNFEKTFLRRVIPFYTFSRKNIELQTKTLFSRPGAIAGEVRAVQTIGDALGGGDLTEEEREALPEWMKSGINTVLNREGSHVTLLSSIGTPIEQPFMQMQSNQLLASVSPILRLPVEMMSNYSAFYGKSISEITNAAAFKDAPGVLKDAIGFTEVQGKLKSGEEFTYYAALRPKTMHLIKNLPPTSRVWSTIESLQREDTPNSVKFWQHLIGFNPRDIDLEVEAARREKENQKELENLLDIAGAGYTSTRFLLNKE